ncbi:MAG: DUF2927 domain-containing protein [Pseudomonadota bacterium]
MSQGTRRFIFGAFLALAGCAPLSSVEVASRSATPGIDRLPPMRTFAPMPIAPPLRSNRDIAQDFLDLAFEMESGRQLAILTRFEGPITLRVAGRAPASLAPDLGRLLTRLRREAGLEITVTQDKDANINIVTLPKAKMQKAVPGAACFVVPNVRSWEEFKQARRGPEVDWARLRSRQQVSVFVPSDAPPQELRDCLHEEIAQALGPLNDLYRLPDSVFNDDNIHTVLTGFDMLILRAHYAPELRNGMTRSEVRAALPALLARLNPAGERAASRFPRSTSRTWKSEMAKALGADRTPAGRKEAAVNAIALSRASGWNDTRLGYANYALGRLTIASEPQRAFAAFREADAIYARDPATALHRAYVGVQLAAFALLDGDAVSVLDITGPHITIAARHENAALLASLLMFRAEALELQGRHAEARAVRMDSLGWARYGFGSHRSISARLREIALLNPAKHGRVSF